MRNWALFVLIYFSVCFQQAAIGSDLQDEDQIEFGITPFSKNLTQQSVSQTFQDSRGTLWFITQEGLNKYTGHTLENYRYSITDTHSISSDHVTKIAEDNNGTLWISTVGGGLNKYDPTINGFHSIFATPHKNSPYSNNIHTIFTSKHGRLWLGYENGFSSFEPDSGQFRHYITTESDKPISGVVNDFAQTNDGVIWAATLGSGIIKIDPNTNKISVLDKDSSSLTSNYTSKIAVDEDNRLWIGTTDAGVTIYDPRSGHTSHLRHSEEDANSISSNQILDIYKDQEKDIWVGTAAGLNRYKESSNNFIRYAGESINLPSERVYSIYQSLEGKYWVGTFYGLASGTKTLFRKYDVTRGHLSSDSVNAFAETTGNTLWIGTDDGLNKLSPESETFEWINEFSSPAISSSIVMSLLGEGNILWVGTFDGGLNRLDLATNSVTVYKHNPLESRSIGSNGITSILRTSTGKLLIGTFGGGIALLDPQEKFFTNFRHNPSDTTTITSDYVIALFEDSLGMIWVGTENGLNRFQLGTGKFERFYTERNNPQSLPSDMVWAFHEDSNQTLWLGTKGGSLSSWEVNQRRRSIREFNNYSEKIALPSSNIYGIKNDSNGNLWLSHNRGVTRFNPITFKSRQFGIRDGLQDNEFNMGASFKSSTGSILFGGNRGYNVITAENLEDTTSPPEVNISSIKIMNETRRFEKPYHSLDKLELGYEDRMVSIEFYATDYTSPDLTTYAYKLEGINPDWIVSKEARIASFTTLPAGKYNLLLAAASPDGAWNWEAKKLPIVVHPPPWQSPIAYAIYAVVLTAIAWGIAYRQRRQAALALERQKELEAKVQERTADLEKAREVAVQASKAKSEFLATMSHEIRTPMHGMIGMTELLLHTELSEQQKQFANAAHNSGESLLGLINEILDFSKLEASKVELEIVDFSLYELVDEVCYLQGEPAQRKGLNLTNIYTSKLPKLVAGDPAKIRQVLMNLTSNSIKFTHKGNVSVKISCSDKLKENGLFTADITVTDDGIGMDEETQTKVFEAFTQADASTTREYGGTGLGLAISRQYVDLMGGEIHVKSKLGVGTQITISVPLESKSEPQTATPLNATLVAEVYCEEKNTREMIRSQLEIVGIEATDDTTIHGSQGDSSSERIRIVDLDSYDIKLVDSLKGSSNNQHKGIALTKLAQVAPPKDLENWIVLGKPLTGSLLDDALSRYLGSSTTEQQPANLKPRPADENQKVILVAEDVETNQKIAREMIEMLGCKVKIAENGLDAFEQFKQTNFDLVFMDCQMPVMDGFQSTRSIRKYEEENKITPTPIVALTAGINQSDREDCKSSGMDQYLTKPFSIAELKDAIEICSGSIDKKSTAPPPKQPELSSDADTPSDDTLFNYTAIENLIEVERQTGNKILPEIFNGFTSQMESKLKELENDITGKDFEAMYKTAHAIKSMSANIGAKKVREISLEVESKGKAGEPIDYTPFLNLLQTEYQEFRTAFENRFLD